MSRNNNHKAALDWAPGEPPRAKSAIGRGSII